MTRARTSAIAVIPFKEALGERARLTLWLLMAAAAFVMIISAANVANLTLMRSVRREHELVVRAALGAGVGRLRRLLLVENLMLALARRDASASRWPSAECGLLVSFAARYSTRATRDSPRHCGAELRARLVGVDGAGVVVRGVLAEGRNARRA